jgi:plastocyanin
MRTRTLLRPLAALAAGLFLVLGLAACGDDDDDAADTGDEAVVTTTTAAGGGAEEADEVTVTATDNAYDTTTLTVGPGEEIYLQNDGSNPHTITSDDEGAFDTGRIEGGAEGELVAPTEPGTYAFHCDVHPTAMTGTLTVA